jgi:hypothetical protein
MNLKYRTICELLYLPVCSLILYFCLFGFLLKNPLTKKEVAQSFENKLNYSKSIGSRKKIVIAAASNGFYSHSCAVLENELEILCVNASTVASLGIEYILEKSKEYINKGDVVILPLEYDFYTLNQTQTNLRDANNFILQYDKKYLFSLNLGRFLDVIFSFDFKSLFPSILENILAFGGVPSRFDPNGLNVNGDKIKHSAEKGKAFRIHLRDAVQRKPSQLLFLNKTFYSREVIIKFLNWCKERQVVVLGSLPTAFDDEEINPEAIEIIKNIYTSNNAFFINLSNNSQYPRGSFYDDNYHLNLEAQKLHSKEISLFLEKFFKNPRFF